MQLGLSEADVAVLAGLFALESLNPSVPAREILFESARRLFRGLVAEGPAIVLFEDIQNLDSLERGLLAHCASVAAEGPLLLLCSTRGQLHAGLQSAGVTQIALGRLADHGVAQLLSDHFDAPAVAPELLALVTRSAEGNPLYAQEVVKALEAANRIRIELGTAVLVGGDSDFDIPPSVEGLVGTRIDALDPASKGILQVVATVGMAAPVALLRESTGIVGVEAIIDDLVEHALLRRDGERESATVEFPSRVLWEVARKGILGVQRRDYHRMVAEGMGRFYADHIEPHLETKAGHHAAGGQWLEAAQATLRAGDIHQRGHYLEQALACYQIGVAWLEHVPSLEQTEGEAVFHRRIGGLLRLLARWSEAERHLHLALDAAEEVGYGREEAHVYLEMGRVCLANNRFAEAKGLLEETLSLSAAYEYADIEAEAVVARADLAVGQADYEFAEQLFQRVLDGAANTPGLAAHALLGLASRAIHQGEKNRALRLLVRARELATLAGDRIVLGRIENNMGLVHFLDDDYTKALECFRTALEVRQGIGYRRGVVINLHNIGDAHFHLGDNARAFAAFDRSRQLAEEIDWDVGMVMNDVFLGYLNAIRGEDSGVQMLSAALERARRNADHSVMAIGHWLYGRYNREQGDEPAATRHFERGLDAARVFGDQYLIKLIEAAH
jgi:adenylate cyclase